MISPLYELRRGKWANASCFTLLGGAFVSLVLHLTLGCDSHGLLGVLATLFIVVGLTLGCLSGFSKPPFSSWERFPRLDYWVWSLILSEYVLKAFLMVFIPWATQPPGWAGVLF